MSSTLLPIASRFDAVPISLIESELFSRCTARFSKIRTRGAGAVAGHKVEVTIEIPIDRHQCPRIVREIEASHRRHIREVRDLIVVLRAPEVEEEVVALVAAPRSALVHAAVELGGRRGERAILPLVTVR